MMMDRWRWAADKAGKRRFGVGRGQGGVDVDDDEGNDGGATDGWLDNRLMHNNYVMPLRTKM
jgi:hypothetical protein